jgi:hypothetical protein
MSTPWRLVCVVVLAAGLGGCSDAATDTSTDGGVASTSPSASTASPRDVLPPGDEALDLVWFSDSTGWGVPHQWADRIAEEFDVQVRWHDHTAGGLAAVEVLRSLGLEPDGQPAGGPSRIGDTTGDVADAEIVVVLGGPTRSTDALEQCATTSAAPRDPPTRYAPEDFAPYEQVLDAIYERVFELVGNRPVIVRALDFYNPVLVPWAEAGVQAECMAAWEEMNASVRRAADRAGVPLVSVHDVFNGPGHDEDPLDKGYIGPDGEHTTPQGQAAIVDAVHRAGYEPIDRG